MDINKIVFRFVNISFSILVLLLIFVGLVKAGTYCYGFGYRVFTEKPVDAAPGREVVVQVDEDMSGMALGKMLEEKGLVDDAKLFYVQLKLSAYSNRINAGVYTLNTSMTAKEMMVVMSTVVEEDTETGSETQTETTEEQTETSSEDNTGE